MSTLNDLKRLLQTEPDLVDRIFDYVLSDPELALALQRLQAKNPQQVDKLKSAVRAEFSGETVYIASRPNLSEKILALFNGRNATEVARRLQISRATVYRHIKQPGQPKKPSQILGK